MNPYTKQAHTSFFSTKGTSAHYSVGVKKLLILIIFFYILSLLQTSFFIHFDFFRFFPNIILVSQILITVFEDPNKNLAIFSAVSAGFFWDIFSENPVGFGILILLSISVFLKIILRKYVRIPILKQF